MKRYTLCLCIIFLTLLSLDASSNDKRLQQAKPPNILLVISDDQSYPFASAYGYSSISTPGFDRVANEGVLFMNAMSASPGCSPSRAALLTGKNCWELEEAATHASSFSKKYLVYPDILETHGYVVGYTGKGWAPGNWKISGRDRNPAGTEYNAITLVNNPKGIANTDYAANFESFLSKTNSRPFCFWFGGKEPHREFDKGIGLRNGKSASGVVVPAFLPDNTEVRNDILDYIFEIEWFDKQLEKAIALLEKAGELDNTLIVVTSDNGMAFPRAKANTYEYGIHVPLAIRWGKKISAKQIINTPVSLTDLAPTFLEVAGINLSSKNYFISGTSLVKILQGKKDPVLDSRIGVYASRERHSSSRWNNLGYPQRALRTKQYLFINNLEPGRWPAGDPQEYQKNKVTGQLTLGDAHGAYRDIDAAPTLDIFTAGHNDTAIARYLHWAVDKRPPEELYDIIKDPDCLHNLITDPNYEKIKVRLRSDLTQYRKKTNDPRSSGKDSLVEAYPRYEGEMRTFPPPH